MKKRPIRRQFGSSLPVAQGPLGHSRSSYRETHMQLSLSDKALRVDGLTVPLSRHAILSLICHCLLVLRRLRGEGKEAGRG
jgi:hypothetical protein